MLHGCLGSVGEKTVTEMHHFLRGGSIAVACIFLASAGARAEIVVPKDVSYRARDLQKAPVELVVINDFISMARGIGNVFLIETPEGNVVYDTGVS